MPVFSRKKTENSYGDNEVIATERVSAIDQSMEHIYVHNQRTTDILRKINCQSDMVDCIDTIISETPDGKMAYNIYLRLANQGIKVTWKNATTGRPVKRYDAEFRRFCSSIGRNNSSGLDGILDTLHGCSIARGGMAVEVLVNKDVTEVEDVVVVDPASIVEFEWLPEKKRYAAYQQAPGKEKKDLYDGNFFYVPFEPKPGHPEGTLKFAPAVYIMIQYLQLIQDSSAVLHRIGYPRYDISIDRETFVNSLHDKSESYVRKASNELFREIKNTVAGMGSKSDFLHFNEVTMQAIGGGVNGAGIDVRAWFEVLDPLVVNAFQLTPVLMGRLNSGSYSLGSVEFKIVTDTVDSMRRGSKRILEEIARIWARVHGYNIVPKVEHNPIDWEKELDKLEAQLKEMQLNRRAEEYGYISHDDAASKTMGTEGADNNNSEGMYEYLNKDFRATQSEDTGQDNPEKNPEEGTQNEPQQQSRGNS